MMYKYIEVLLVSNGLSVPNVKGSSEADINQNAVSAAQ